ncbi:MAG: class I SAM-dependent methyltransferase [Ignavibacteriaceae bacterium]
MGNICPACSRENNQFNKFVISQGKRGETYWQKCNWCNSYFSTADYNTEKEKIYTFTETAYGAEKSGIELNKIKDRMFEHIASLIESKKPAPAKLLDIGCSYGGFINKMKNLGYDVEGFDIIASAVSYVVETFKIKAEESSSILEYDKNFEKHFDIVTVLDCNYYWDDQLTEIKEIFKRLQSKGILVMRIADKSKYLTAGKFIKSFSNSVGQAIMRRSVNDHRFSMPLKSFLILLKNSGFQIENISANAAIYSSNTKWLVKLFFILGDIIRKATGINFSPGLVVIARKK